MKWSSSSNSILSNGSIVTMALNNSNNNNNSTMNSSSGSNNSSNCGHNGGIRSAATVRRHESDRRSIFYTDPKDMEIFLKNHNNKKMSPPFSSNRLSTSSNTTKVNAISTPNGNNTNNDIKHSRVHVTGEEIEANEMQRRKCANLISYFTTQISHLTKELEFEKYSRDTHLAKVANALLCFEAKLKSDQRQIRKQLYEKDTQLNRLAHEVLSLREKYGTKDDCIIAQKIDPIAQYCPNCRKQYYCLNNSEVGVQVNKHGQNCSDGKENVKLPTSSSEDGLAEVFSSEVRRSKRYMSKRYKQTIREYLDSRNIDLAFSCSDESFNRSSESSHAQSEQMEHKTLIENKLQDSLIRKGSIRRSSKSAVPMKCDKNGNKLNNYGDSEVEAIDKLDKEMHENDIIAKVLDVKQTIKNVTASNDIYPKIYDDDVDKMKNPQFESNDDWYSSDMDDSDGAVSKPYGYNAVNPVLECVNQILLQQSMDGIMESCANRNEAASSINPNSTSKSTNNNLTESPPKDATNTLKKRVHFSTQNSMVQVPRSDSSSNQYRMDSTGISTTDVCNTKDSSYATIYSNEYEPIGSENNSTNHYVDMDGSERHSVTEKSKTPPALPPKPPNLLKFRQILKIPTFAIQTTPTKSIDNESEPDYCSIGEVQETVKSVQIVADVHKNADDDVSSHASEETKTDMTEETFADVPRLPNVVALLSPKKDATHSKVISQDSYVTKLSPSPPRAKPAVLPTKAVVANLLSEINAQKSKNSINKMSKQKTIADLSEESTKKAQMKLITQQKMTTIVETTTTTQQQVSPNNGVKSLPIIKQNEKMLMPIQAEFDWYNLDVEYGKLLPSNMESGKEEPQDRVEYNLDAEFSLTSCSDNNSSLDSSGSTIHFVPITVAEDCNNGNEYGNQLLETASTTNNVQLLNPARLRKLINKSVTSDVNVKSFDTFLEQTGLTSKPLPQKRKIFYNAPFV